MGYAKFRCNDCGKVSEIELNGEEDLQTMSNAKCPHCGSDDIFYQEIKQDFDNGEVELGKQSNDFYTPW